MGGSIDVVIRVGAVLNRQELEVVWPAAYCGEFSGICREKDAMEWHETRLVLEQRCGEWTVGRGRGKGGGGSKEALQEL